jgi:hypothetical protein
MLDPQESSAPTEPYTPSSHLNTPLSVKSDQTRGKKNGPDRPTTDKADRRVIKFVAVTIDTESAQVVRVEGQDTTGARFELTVDEKINLTARDSHDRLENLVEEAFEAGIACVLGGDTTLDDANESPEDAALRHQLLAPLIERSAVKHWLQPAVLKRAIVSNLIENLPN